MVRSRSPRRRPWFGASSLFVVFGVGGWLGAAGCETGGAREIGPLRMAFGSPEAMARAVVEAVREEDRSALESFLVTAEEHRELLWDSLPERSAMPFEYARSLNERNTRKAIARVLERYGGMSLELLSLRFTEEPEIYASFMLHRGAEVTVRDPESGQEGTIPVLDVVLEMNGGWKPMHYVE